MRKWPRGGHAKKRRIAASRSNEARPVMPRRRGVRCDRNRCEPKERDARVTGGADACPPRRRTRLHLSLHLSCAFCTIWCDVCVLEVVTGEEVTRRLTGLTRRMSWVQVPHRPLTIAPSKQGFIFVFKGFFVALVVGVDALINTADRARLVQYACQCEGKLQVARGRVKVSSNRSATAISRIRDREKS